MEAGFVVLIALFTMAFGIVVGVIIKTFIPTNKATQGTVYAYYGEFDNTPSLLLEGNVPVDEIASRKRVTFDVVVVKENSQK